jgi:hypothetical protein
MPSHLFIKDNTYLDSSLYQAMFSQPTSRTGAVYEIKEPQEFDEGNLVRQDQHADGHSRRHAIPATSYEAIYLMPYHAGRMVEPIFEKIICKPWTPVIHDDRLLRKLICSFFYYPHLCGPFVHKDLFLEDMAAGRNTFCSPLLVNAVLAIASVRAPAIADNVVLKLSLADLPHYPGPV